MEMGGSVGEEKGLFWRANTGPRSKHEARAGSLSPASERVEEVTAAGRGRQC